MGCDPEQPRLLQDLILPTSFSGGGRKKAVGRKKINKRIMGTKVKRELRVTEIAARETIE